MARHLKCLLGLWALGTSNLLAATPTADAGQQLGVFLRQHGYGVIKIDHESHNAQFVAAQIDGKAFRLILDTGSDRTRLSRSCAKDLNLDIKETSKATISTGGRVKGTEGKAKLDSFKLGGYEINRTNVVDVLPKGAQISNSDGLLGYDFLHANDMILPVGAGFIFFKPGNGPMANIEPYMKAMGFKAIALARVSAGLKVQGHLNGAPLSAIVDCGAGFSLFSLKFVLQTKTAVRAIGSGPRGVDGKSETAFVFTPSSLDFGSFILPPENLLTQFSPGLMAVGEQALLGYDLLAEHKAIIDLGHDILWMK